MKTMSSSSCAPRNSVSECWSGSPTGRTTLSPHANVQANEHTTSASPRNAAILTACYRNSRAVTDRVRRAIEIACVFALGAVLSVAYGSPYGTNNQMTYLLEPLARAFPELYHRDWWVASTHHYEVPFGYATAPLYWLDPDGAVALGAAQLVIMVATFIAIYALVVAVTERRRFEIYAGLAGLLSLGAGRALGGTYLFAGYLQPSSLASLAWIIAMVAWVRERRLVAAIALAIGGVFHINFLVLGIGVFALSELCAGTTSAKKLALLLGPSFVVLLVFSPLLLGSSHANEGEFGLHVLTRFALTIHFWPKRVRFEVWALAGWLAIAWSLRDTVINTALARLRWFAICSLGCVFVAVWIFSIPPLLTFTRLMVWRMAPFGQLATLLLLIVAVWRISCGEIPRPQRWSAAGLLVGAAAVVYNAFSVPRGDFAYVITFVMVACVAA